MRVLVIGVSGMLGSAVFKMFSLNQQFEVWGTLRSSSNLNYFPDSSHSKLLVNIDVLDQDSLISVIDKVRPDIVINCVGLIKQLADAKDPLSALPINAMFPHRLAKLCKLANARMIHVSTDCVFSGQTGMYRETDSSDAEDLYGKSKYIGELDDLPHAITLRTSIIGHEQNSNYALVDWFLSQSGEVKGFSKAVFSGLPTVELARVMRDYVVPKPEMFGLYHVSAEPIDKFSLLKMIADVYEKEIEIISDERLKIDRSLDSKRFKEATGYVPPSWQQLIKMMRDFR